MFVKTSKCVAWTAGTILVLGFGLLVAIVLWIIWTFVVGQMRYMF